MKIFSIGLAFGVMLTTILSLLLYPPLLTTLHFYYLYNVEPTISTLSGVAFFLTSFMLGYVFHLIQVKRTKAKEAGYGVNTKLQIEQARRLNKGLSQKKSKV